MSNCVPPKREVWLASDRRAAVRSHEREIRGGSTELGATGGSRQAWGSETRIVRAKLRFRATVGSISGEELAATCEFGREIGKASSEGGTDCVGSQARVQITSTSTRSERSVRFRQVDNLRKITVESGNFGWIICGRCRQEMCCSWEGTRIATISASFYGRICDCSDYARVTRGSRATRNAHMIRLVESFHLQKKMPD